MSCNGCTAPNWGVSFLRKFCNLKSGAVHGVPSMSGLQPSRLLLLLLLLCCVSAAAQVLSLTRPGDSMTSSMSINAIQAAQLDFNFFQIDTQNAGSSPLEGASGSMSKLDLKAPGKAWSEYNKGYQLLMRKDSQGSLEHFNKATAIYPNFVAAHRALGTAYLNLGQHEQARDAFLRAVALDDHLPTSYLNLGCAELALKQYSEAEESLRKAASIAPLDIPLKIALVYGEFVNQDYPGVLETAHQVHEGKHKGAALVHYFAAGALAAQDKYSEAEREMEVLLSEDPKSPSAGQFRQILEQIKNEQVTRAAQAEQAKLQLAQPMTLSLNQGPTAEDASRQGQSVLQNLKEKQEIAEAEAAPDPSCVDCGVAGGANSTVASNTGSRPRPFDKKVPGAVLRASVDEVTLVFTATDHGKSVMNLTASDIGIRDDSRPPDSILGFRNESQLPLRLGLVIDTSDSVTERLSFEEGAAIKFLQKVVIDQKDLAFVIGVSNSVLIVQDFTADQMLISHAVNQLAPGGGTALWDAVAYAADKLKSRPEVQPVARILVVISDGNDNSSNSTLKEAIATAQRDEVAVYTVSTRDISNAADADFLGDHALRTFSEMTGGAAFIPGSVKRLDGSLAELQQVIRGRYLISYKPASFRRDGRYRAIDIEAQKDGRKLKVVARRGYYALGPQSAPGNQ